ncbi:MAG: hypothetical protein HY906_08575 [Deltaproteobacteria bacterium]|nr:hypothetical protein [Deltaproteobacteria bacterium]
MTAPGATPRPEGRLARAGRVLRSLFGHLWRALLWFLEAVGLRSGARAMAEQQLSRFKLDYAEFRQLLSGNNSFLEEVTDLEQKLMGDEPFDLAYLKRKVVRAVADVHRMERSLNAIARGRYPTLRPALERITAALGAALDEPERTADARLCRPLATIGRDDGPSCGGKMANLGEVRNVVGLTTPDGFTITTDAYRLLCEENGLDALVAKEHLGIVGADDIEAVSRSLRDLVLGARIPARLRDEISRAIAAVREAAGDGVLMAVRSSAVGEDTERSFAGQFATELNVPLAEVPAAYLRVVASLYAPGAMHYRLLQGIPGEHAAMAVGCITMVAARLSGVCFSCDASRPAEREVLIHSVPGLGAALVDGSMTPAAVRVTRGSAPPQVIRPPAAPARGVRPDASLAPPPGEAPSCTDAEALGLARLALTLEAHFGGPQDIEWALERTGRLVVLQSRPLRLTDAETGRAAADPAAAVLLAAGDVACPGVGCGPVVHLPEDGELDSFPAGAVLVARRSSPKFVRLMGKARAIVTDAGSTTGHMASLARELRVPTLIGTGSATSVLLPGTLVTVDASNRIVYAGEVRELLAAATGEPRSRHSRMVGTPVHAVLQEVAARMVPLALTDPRAPGFTPECCETLHDVARYIHEKSYEEMFGMGERLGDFRSLSCQLDVFLPIDLYVIDLGGGLKAAVGGRKVGRGQVTSRPLRALLDGMLHEGIPRYGPRPLDVRGLLSIMARHAMTSPENERTFRDPCYAIISDRYLNYTARVGYHFSVVDCYCGQTANKNYISFQFQGGAADLERRTRRVRVITGVLQERGFAVDARRDLVTARLSKGNADEIAGHLDTIGRLLQFVRQLDVVMVSEGTVEWIKAAFLAGNYSLTGEPPRHA